MGLFSLKEAKVATKNFGREDAGCYIDGAFGIDHARQRLAELLACVPQSSKVRRLIAELESEENTDYVYEAMEEAVDILALYTVEDMIWLFEAGDLVLTEAIEELD